MRVKRSSGSGERKILASMLVDPLVLSRLAIRWQPDLFKSKHAQIVAQWCIDHFHKYGKPPGEAIQTILEEWSETAGEDSIKAMEQFISGLDCVEQTEDPKEAEVLIDEAERHLNKNRIEKLMNSLEGTTKLSTQLEALQNFHPVDLSPMARVEVFQDNPHAVFKESPKPLIRFGKELKALGQFFGSSLCRDGFVAFLGPEKRGKSFWLLEMAYRATLFERKRVAFFQAGDMTQNQFWRRVLQRASGRPSGKRRYKVPTGLESKKEGVVLAKFKGTPGKPPIDGSSARRGQERARKSLRSKEPYFYLSTHPAGTLSVAGIRDVLDGWQKEGWEPDVIVIDYADILSPPPGIRDGRDQINENWKQLRALSQTQNCLVLTATQADTRSYDAPIITRKNFSDDKRKLAHVTGMVGLNQNKEEQRDGVYRLNWVGLREGPYTEDAVVYVLGCLAIARPAMFSLSEKEVFRKRQEEEDNED